MARRPRRSPNASPAKAAESPAPQATEVPPTPAAPFWSRFRLSFAVAVLLAIHLGLATRSLILENPTIDEVIHLPAAITYWQKGTFRLYHHNPPLIKLVAALPLILGGNIDMPYDSRSSTWNVEPLNKAAFAHDFMERNAHDYFELFTRSRIIMPFFSVLAGLVVFFWSKRLYGAGGGLLSLALWCFCPNVLAHCRLITTDIGSSAFGILATFVFWLYLQKSTWFRATCTGVVLGLAQLSKFSLILLYGIWPIMGLLHLLINQDTTRRLRRLLVGAGQGLLILVLSFLTIDVGYGFEGVGIPLGRYEFICKTLTEPVPPGMWRPDDPDMLRNRALKYRVNRFRGTLLGSIPVPLPEHYMLGFDDQKIEAEGVPEKFIGPAGGDELRGYPVYLNGVLQQKSWWYYYIAALAYKVPEGTWLIVLTSWVLLIGSRRSRAAWFDEFAVLAVPTVIMTAITFFTNINIGLRYVLPAFPYIYVSAGKVIPWASGFRKRGHWVASGFVAVCLLGTVTATLRIHPHYLAYFNDVSGGPANGALHLIDSNLDWGQDLVGLKRWIDANAKGERIGVAYFGQINPSIFNLRQEGGFPWFLPPPLPETMPLVPLSARDAVKSGSIRPGLYAVSVSLLHGLPYRIYDPSRIAPWESWFNAFGYFQDLKPIANIGYSINIYRVTPEDSERLRHYWSPPSR
ncbi:ArnT family glycosyltransferase [Singulisphaera sp. PoT]|uniref:ArnT family glycosyltransferase n=1 Tax=Singulisphaera sp. PoT TaxID=3411797 RepID=UPI003BF48B55